MANVTLTAVLHREDNLYVAECPEVGTVSQGYTIEEALANLTEATELYSDVSCLSIANWQLEHCAEYSSRQ